MKRMFKSLLYILITVSVISLNANINVSNAAPTAAPVKQTKTTATTSILNVSPVDVVNCPSKYLNKTITFNAEFVTYTSLGLDYKPAYRDPAKYIGLLIKRPDVTDHTIPLSEMKIFLTREVAEKNIDLEAGDKVKITGNVFSTALGDPWVDVKTFTVLSQKNKTEKK